MPREERDEVIGQTGVPRSCCGSGPPRPINQSGGHAQMSSGLESSADFQEEAGYTYASVAVPQSLNYALTPRAGPYIDHNIGTLIAAPKRALHQVPVSECTNLMHSDLVRLPGSSSVGL